MSESLSKITSINRNSGNLISRLKRGELPGDEDYTQEIGGVFNSKNKKETRDFLEHLAIHGIPDVYFGTPKQFFEEYCSEDYLERHELDFGKPDPAQRAVYYGNYDVFKAIYDPNKNYREFKQHPFMLSSRISGDEKLRFEFRSFILEQKDKNGMKLLDKVFDDIADAKDGAVEKLKSILEPLPLNKQKCALQTTASRTPEKIVALLKETQNPADFGDVIDLLEESFVEKFSQNLQTKAYKLNHLLESLYEAYKSQETNSIENLRQALGLEIEAILEDKETSFAILTLSDENSWSFIKNISNYVFDFDEEPEFSVDMYMVLAKILKKTPQGKMRELLLLEDGKADFLLEGLVRKILKYAEDRDLKLLQAAIENSPQELKREIFELEYEGETMITGLVEGLYEHIKDSGAQANKMIQWKEESLKNLLNLAKDHNISLLEKEKKLLEIYALHNPNQELVEQINLLENS